MSGNKLGGPEYRTLGTSIVPGQTIDISLVLIAPGTDGMYKGSYLLADANGVTFGVGVNGKGTFFVSIQQGTSPSTSSEQVSLSTRTAHAGDAVTVNVSGFPANSEIDYRVGRKGEDFVLVYDGLVGSDGTTSKIITIPGYAINGEYWVVQVITTSLRDVLAIASQSIYITDTTIPPYTGNVQVDLSTTLARPGDLVTVYVRGFPANAKIDFRVGEQGKQYSVVYDGTVGSNGTTIQLITIPTRAIYGQYWVVQVITTNSLDVVTITSHTIYITQ